MRNIIIAIGAVVLLAFGLLLKTGLAINTIEQTAFEWVPSFSFIIHTIFHFSVSFILFLYLSCHTQTHTHEEDSDEMILDT
jgi:hypothetical protein